MVCIRHSEFMLLNFFLIVGLSSSDSWKCAGELIGSTIKNFLFSLLLFNCGYQMIYELVNKITIVGHWWFLAIQLSHHFPHRFLYPFRFLSDPIKWPITQCVVPCFTTPIGQKFNAVQFYFLVSAVCTGDWCEASCLMIFVVSFFYSLFLTKGNLCHSWPMFDDRRVLCF